MKYSYIFLLFAFALSTTGSIAQGNCSTVDLEYICQNTEYVQSIAFQCGIDCMAEDADCLEQCMLDALALSTPCIGCFGEQVICIVKFLAVDGCRIVPQHAFLEQKQNAPNVRFKIARQILMFALESLMKTTTLGRICVIVTIPILLSTPVQTAQAKVLTTIVMA